MQRHAFHHGQCLATKAVYARRCYLLLLGDAAFICDKRLLLSSSRTTIICLLPVLYLPEMLDLLMQWADIIIDAISHYYSPWPLPASAIARVY